MGELFARVIPLAIGGAISPAILTFQLVVLGGRTAPVRRAWALAAGYALVLLVEAAFGFALASRTGGSDTPDHTVGVLKLCAAGLLVAIGIRSIVHTSKPKAHTESGDPHLVRYAGIGIALMVTNFTTVALFLPAVHQIGISDAGTAAQAIAFGLVLLISLMPVYVPPLAATVLGDPALRTMRRLDDFLARHSRAIGAIVCFGFAVLLGLEGFAEL